MRSGTSGRRRAIIQSQITRNKMSPSREIRRMYSRSALTRRSVAHIDPLHEEQNDDNQYDYINEQDQTGFTPLHKSVLKRSYKNTRWMVSRFADVNILSEAAGLAAIHLACRHGDIVSAQIILTSPKCDVNKQDKSGWTALHHCALNDHVFLAEMLLAANADPNITNQEQYLPIQAATSYEMKNLLYEHMEDRNKNQQRLNPLMECIEIPYKGGDYFSDKLGLMIEVDNLALKKDLFFICKRKSPSQSPLKLGASEVLISDVYEFWPNDIKLLSRIAISVSCVPSTEKDEIILKVADDEVSLLKDVKASTYSRPRTAPVSRKSNRTMSIACPEGFEKFASNRLGLLYVVSRLTKETSIIPLLGTTIQHSSDDRFNVVIPKNGLNSRCKVSLQLYPVELDLIYSIRRQHSNIISVGPVCEVTHTDSELQSRRLVTMSIPPPTNYCVYKNGVSNDYKVVVVSGTSTEGEIEILEKCQYVDGAIEFLTRYLAWKVAVLVRSVNQSSLADICDSLRNYTSKRTRFASLHIAHKLDSQKHLTIFTAITSTSDNCTLPPGFIESQPADTITVYEGEQLMLTLGDNQPVVNLSTFVRFPCEKSINLGRVRSKKQRVEIIRKSGESKPIGVVEISV